MKKEIRIVAIPTKNASNIKFIPKGEYDEIDGKLVKTTTDRYLYVEEATEFGYPSTFLYGIIDEQPQIGDWFIVELFSIIGKSVGLRLEQCLFIDDVWVNNTSPEKTRHIENCKKVVATTDKSLNIVCDGFCAKNECVCIFPQISPEFQQAWVREDTKDTPIVEALMEMEELYLYPDGNLSKTSRLAPNAIPILQPKMNSQGYVTILPKVEKIYMYSREEVTELIKNALTHFMPMNNHFEEDENRYIEQNL